MSIHVTIKIRDLNKMEREFEKYSSNAIGITFFCKSGNRWFVPHTNLQLLHIQEISEEGDSE